MQEALNRIYNLDCVEGMQRLYKKYGECVDLIVTSPPYDNLRTYSDEFNGIDLHAVGESMFQLLKDGGLVCMVIQDSTKDFGKSCTTYRTIVDYVDRIGFKLFENVIYARDGRPGAWWNSRFRVDHEYILMFLKGKRPLFFDKEHLKIPAKYAGATFHGTTRHTDGSLRKISPKVQSDTKCRGTIWHIESSKSEGDKTKLKHPATFPDQLASDLIRTFCPENGVVLDPFMGSGTTAKMSVLSDRNFIGFEISKEYIEICNERIKSLKGVVDGR